MKTSWSLGGRVHAEVKADDPGSQSQEGKLPALPSGSLLPKGLCHMFRVINTSHTQASSPFNVHLPNYDIWYQPPYFPTTAQGSGWHSERGWE